MIAESGQSALLLSRLFDEFNKRAPEDSALPSFFRQKDLLLNQHSGPYL
jgi:hypothetical protein